jgi:hypothetical protein
MAQMAYMEVDLCVDMDWLTILTSSQAQQQSNYHRILWLIET